MTHSNWKKTEELLHSFQIYIQAVFSLYLNKIFSAINQSKLRQNETDESGLPLCLNINTHCRSPCPSEAQRARFLSQTTSSGLCLSFHFTCTTHTLLKKAIVLKRYYFCFLDHPSSGQRLCKFILEQLLVKQRKSRLINLSSASNIYQSE